MAPIMGSSAPLRVQLDAPRHSPYATSQRSSKDKISPRSSGSSRLSQASSPRSSLVGASLKPTPSMLEEFEVDKLLGNCVSRSDSLQTLRLSRSTTDRASSLFQPHPPAATHTSSIGDSSRQASPLSRTSTATTILEFPSGPPGPSYGTFSISAGTFSEFDGFERIDESLLDDGSWIDTTQELGDTINPTSDMTFRSPLSDACESDDDADTTITRAPLPLTYHESTDMMSPGSSVDEVSSLSSDSVPRKRIWEVSPDQYVPRPKGIPARSAASVLEIGMQWEKDHQQGGLRSRGARDFAGMAVGHFRRVYGDAQYMN